MKNTLLVFATKNLNNCLNEIKEYLDFSLVFFEENNFYKSSLSSINCVLIENSITSNLLFIESINKIKNKPFLLLAPNEVSNSNDLKFDEKIFLPFSLREINNKVDNLIISAKFNQNSSIKIKEYFVDKNEKKLKKGNISTPLTEREIQLILLLFNEAKPVSKITILNKVWNYSQNADTHTIETHIYRLRKKIFNKFKDNNFIINSKAGYSI
jgi:hypothetical protein